VAVRAGKAYEQVAERLRESIVAGDLARGARLPNENVLAADFGVSRATVREALRLLAAQNLIRTAKGAGGGSYVTAPSVDHISDFVCSSISLLAGAREVSLDDLLEARELLEAPAARLAAERRQRGDVELLRAAIPVETEGLGADERFAYNAAFHQQLIVTSGNTLLGLAAQPLFAVLRTSLSRATLGRRFHRAVDAQHIRIAAAVDAADADAAEAEMRAHLAFLRPYYEHAWHDGR
jgi:DNA-binding FadR family transcriptional regulator